MLKPRIHGWRLAAGIVLWAAAVLATVAQVLGELGGAGEGGWIEALVIPVALLVLAAGFWRGSQLARWLAIVPACLLLLAAAFIAGIVGICSGGDVGAGVCFPELSIEQLTRLWPATLILIAASGVVLIGIWRPGVREPGRVEQP